MPLQINKQLTRPDGDTIASGSIIKMNISQNEIDDKYFVVFKMSHYVDAQAVIDKKDHIQKIDEFGYIETLEVNFGLWTMMLNNPNSRTLVEGWLKDIIEGYIGVGFIDVI